MANKSITLSKTIWSNKYANETYQKSFSKLAKSKLPMDQSKVIDLYEDLFYVFSKNGKNSHEDIHEQSYNYINLNHNKSLDSQLKTHLETNAQRTKELSDKETGLENEHPVYPNGSFLIRGENGIKYQNADTIYVMQEGRVRPVHGEVWATLRRARGLPEDYSGKYFITQNEFDSLWDTSSGPDIQNTTDLLTHGEDLIVDRPPILGTTAWTEVRFFCKGNEVEDSYNIVIEEDDAAAGQFYLDHGNCIIKYIVDEYVNDSIQPKVETVTLEKGEKKTIKIVRRTEDGSNGIPSFVSDWYEQHNPEAILYNGNTIDNYVKNWGPWGDYPGVVSAEGRIEARELENTYIQNTLGIPHDPSYKLFNGLPSSGTGYWDVVDDPNLGKEVSNYGTRKLYPPGSGFYGALNQPSSLQDKFNNMDNMYYYGSSYHGYKLYGQPIFHHSSAGYFVFLKGTAHRGFLGIGIFRDFAIYSLSTGDVRYWDRKDCESAIGVKMRYKKNTLTIYGIDYSPMWKEGNRKRVAFIGLPGVPLNSGPSENIFNRKDNNFLYEYPEYGIYNNG